MNWILLATIHVYWFLIPKNKRRKCIFRKSCSHFVYDTTKEHGIRQGLTALKFRFNNCRSGFELFKDPVNNKTQMMLPSKLIIDSDEIAERLVINTL